MLSVLLVRQGRQESKAAGDGVLALRQLRSAVASGPAAAEVRATVVAPMTRRAPGAEAIRPVQGACMIDSAEIGRFEFVKLASLRTVQLMRGCTPRVAAGWKRTTTAQREVADGKVIRAPRPYRLAVERTRAGPDVE